MICENVVPQTQQGTSTINVTEVTVMLFQRILKFVLHKAKLSHCMISTVHINEPGTFWGFLS